MRRFAVLGSVSGLLFSAFAACLPHGVQAQSYPAKPIRMLIGYPPGGGVDIVARQIGPKYGEQLGQPIVIDNRPGAAGNIASDLLAKAPADGYVLMMSTPSVTINPSLYAKVGFDPIRDFAPITMVGVTPLILVVHPSLPAKSVKDLVALAKARPGQLLYSSGGNGSAAHLAGELLKSVTGTSIVHVPFKGAPPSMVALIGGEVHFTFGALTSTLPHVKSGRLRMLAVTSAQRSAFVPDLPTVSEAGISGYDVTQWYGLFAPAQTPAAIIAKLNSDLIRILDLPDVKAQMAALSLEIMTGTPQQFAAFVKSELVKWAKVVKESNMRVD